MECLSNYELVSLILQCIGTIVAVVACIGIYYAKGSLDLARKDYQRRLALETYQYWEKKFGKLDQYDYLRTQVMVRGVDYIMSKDNEDVRKEIVGFLNLLETLTFYLKIDNKFDREYYDTEIIRNNIISEVTFAKKYLKEYIYERRGKNPRVWQGLTTMFEKIATE